MRVCLALLIVAASAQAREGPRADAEGNPLPAAAVSRIGSLSMLSGGPVFSLSFSRDGKRLASAARDGKLLVWDVPAGRILRHFDTLSPAAVALSPDGTILAALSLHRTLE